MFLISQEVEQQRNTIVDLEQRLANAEADEQARLKEKQEEKVMSFAFFIMLLQYCAV